LAPSVASTFLIALLALGSLAVRELRTYGKTLN
jgi:hypothetical protein